MAPHSLEKTSAISLEKIAGTAPDLIDMYKDAETSLRKSNRLGGRAAVYLVIDRSLSMEPYFADGSVQRLSDQILSLAAHLDDDGKVPVGFFSTEMHTVSRRGVLRRPRPFVDIELGTHQGRIAELHNSLGAMGGTWYRPAMEAVLDHYRASSAYAASTPAFVVFQTDGGPQDEAEAAEFLQTTRDENVRWQFVPFGAVPHFSVLSRLPGNTGVSALGSDPQALSNSDLYNRLAVGLPQA
ncbi:VWA domain-containing protein [Streptomyces sp. NPDC091416]|uniref:VWA domain-containing protein n=1 Tax=Streptomyces sp. NPDC091416 TaxID=3366003 RepID=UPI003827BCB4